MDFLIPASFEKIGEILDHISQTSYFDIVVDPSKKPTPRRARYQVLWRQDEMKSPILLGLLEMVRKVNTTQVIIKDRNSMTWDTMPGTGSPITRFISLFTKNVMMDTDIPSGRFGGE
jgi:hypothetical protein